MAESEVTAVNIPFPDAQDRHLRIGVGACRLKIEPGDGQAWVTGSYHDPTRSVPIGVSQEGGTARITQRPSVGNPLNFFSGAPRLELSLGKGAPYALTVEGGASENVLDLGGLPIRRLNLRHGAGRMEIDFSAPNPDEMSLLQVAAGAEAFEARRLANANFAEMQVEGGAASYNLDFSGTLRRSGHVRISTGVSSVEVHVPSTVAAKVISESLIGGMDIGDGWIKREGAFQTEAAAAGGTPVLTIETTVALGALRLRTT